MAGIALVVAFVTFRFLSSTGKAKTQLGELGGAAAGFVVTFGVLSGTYYALEPRWSNTADLKKTVADQRRLIESSKLPTGFAVPGTFTAVVDRPHGVAYGYPSHWVKTYSLQTFQQDPLSAASRRSPVNLVVVAEPVQRKAYALGEVYAAARDSGISAAQVRKQLGVALTKKTAKLEVPLRNVLLLLGARGKSTREAIYDSGYQVLRATFAGQVIRRDDRTIDGIPSLDVEHRGSGPSGSQILQFMTETYVPQRQTLISLTFTGTAGARAALNDVRERVLGTLKFIQPPRAS
jgi:hypothetical protein